MGGFQLCQSSSECTNPGDTCMSFGGMGGAGGAMAAFCINPDAGRGMFPFPDGGFMFPDGGFMFPDGGFTFPDGGFMFPDGGFGDGGMGMMMPADAGGD
jgi:hypothetical protein